MVFRSRRVALGLIMSLAVAACATPEAQNPETLASRSMDLHANETPELRNLIENAAQEYDVPVDLVHRVIIRESRHRPDARNGPYYGLMQILPQTAQTMGFRGQPTDLLDPETNLRYAVRYLRGAWLLADGSQERAVMWYARGYYYEARRRGMLQETGLRS